MGRAGGGAAARRTPRDGHRRCHGDQYQPFHDIRVRNYEADLSACRIPLSDVLDPVDIGHIAAEVTAIDTTARSVTVSGREAQRTQRYDRLVMALGSRVATPDIPGLREFGFDVDTYDAR